MSTGLTYVNIIDGSSSAPDLESGTTIFNSYDEAYVWADWYMRYRIASSNPGVTITIWTSGPSQSGYWYYSGGIPVFAAFD